MDIKLERWNQTISICFEGEVNWILTPCFTGLTVLVLVFISFMSFVFSEAIAVKEKLDIGDTVFDPKENVAKGAKLKQEPTSLEELYLKYPKQNGSERSERRRKASYYISSENCSNRSDSEIATTMLSLLMDPHNISILSSPCSTHFELLTTLSRLKENILDDKLNSDSKQDVGNLYVDPHEVV